MLSFLFIFIFGLFSRGWSATQLSYYDFEGSQDIDQVFSNSDTGFEHCQQVSVKRTTNQPHSGSLCVRLNVGTVGYDALTGALCRSNTHANIGPFQYGHSDNFGQYTQEQAFIRFWFKYDANATWNTGIKLIHGIGHNFNDHYSYNYSTYNTPALSPVFADKPNSIFDNQWHKVEVYHDYTGSDITHIRVWVDEHLIFDLDADDFNTEEEQQLYPQRPEHLAFIHEHTWHFRIYIERYNDYYSVSHLRELDERLWTDSPYPKIDRNGTPEEITLFETNTDYVYMRCYSHDYLFNEIKLIKDETTGIGEQTDGHYAQGTGQLIVEYWNGSDWQEVDNLQDGTTVGENTLAQDGTITWTALTSEQWSNRWGFILDGGYRWLRLHVENNPSQGLKPDFFIPQYSLGVQLDDIEIWDGLPEDHPGSDPPAASTHRQNNILVSPNPSSSKIVFHFMKTPALTLFSPVEIGLFNLEGNLAVKKTEVLNMFPQAIELDAHKLAPGVYIYKVDQSGRKLQTGKIAVKK